MYKETSQPPEPYFGWGPSLYGSNLVPEYMGAEFVRAEFVRVRVCQGPSLLGAEMSRNRLKCLRIRQDSSPTHLSIFLLDNFAGFLSSADFFQNQLFSEISSENTIRLSIFICI